ncbi:hypothetical protein [Streptomyces sp. ISL-100]|nr:hypothetical protein [Streptomyces sp. ISL-100]MBT2401951.1 hypothetical protein [Streptomyces sp. ISL-100]
MRRLRPGADEDSGARYAALGIVPDAYEPHLDVDFTKLRDGFDEEAA